MSVEVVYVAGPFRADNAWEIEQNIRRAETEALRVWQMGVAAVCPHANNRFYQGAADDDVWLAGDLKMLERCDAMLLVDGWQNSIGAVIEKRHAEEHGIPVLADIADLRKLIEQEKNTPNRRGGHRGLERAVRIMEMPLSNMPDQDVVHMSVAMNQTAAYRQVMADLVWFLLDDLVNDLISGSRDKGMHRTEHFSRLDLSNDMIEKIRDAISAELYDRGIDLDAALGG